jgi:ribose transport system ATP-binding protein
MTPYKVELQNIDKSFGGIHALKNVSLKARPGEIHALVGENGAGKSTLVKILAGAYRLDRGRILIDGRVVQINHPKEGKDARVAIIYQEMSLIPDLSVAENIYLHFLNQHKTWMPWKEINARSGELISRLGFQIPAAAKVRDLSIAHQQVVEIAKALSEDVEILILDEPTAVLAPNETRKLFDVLNTLKGSGVTIIYISHRLEEVFQIADTITVLKDGKHSATLKASRTGQDKVIHHMIGRELETLYPERTIIPGEEILRVNHLNAGKKVRDISFTVRTGDVLGIAGLVGSGRTEMIRAVFSADRRVGGDIILAGEKQKINSVRDAVRAGLGFVPADRKTQGVILPLSVRKNLTLTDLNSVSSMPGWISDKKDFIKSNELMKILRIKAGGVESEVRQLSGGNQQKVALAKWLGRTCKVILMDEPTRGIDVGAKAEIYQLISDLSDTGISIIMVSSEMTEVMGMCDRIMVMADGRISGELQKGEYTEEKILRMCIDRNEHHAINK